MNPNLVLPIDNGQVSDGFHTFDELYAHRSVLLICLMHAHPELSWRTTSSEHEGFFYAGMLLPTGQISYHLRDRYSPLLDGIKTLSEPPEWDGHTSDNVLERFQSWILQHT